MKRLTKKSKYYGIYYDTFPEHRWENADTLQQQYSQLVNKLGAFEDFMEEQGFESLEELKELLSANYKLVNAVDGLDKDYICECLVKYPKMQEKWNKLKEHIKDRDDAWFDFKYILDKMQKLEEEE